jgi:2-methylcitrate dehydratase PrpD
LADIPADVLDLAVAQAMSQAAALQATRRHPVGPRLAALVEPGGWEQAAASVALMTMALDFDETAFAGHLGHSCSLPVLACAAATGVSGARAMVASVAASEVAARVTAAVTLGSARGQTAAHTHAVGAVVGAAVVLDLAPETLLTALSLALGQPRRVLLPAFMGSDAKFWVAATPILDAARAIRQAQQGARGLDGIMEARGGVLEELADVPLPEALSGFGDRWHLRTLSIKAIPGCAYLTSAVEAAAELGPLDLAEVERVEADVSVFTLGMEVQSAPFLDGPATPLPALGFSTGYNLAAALETGGLDVDDLHGERLGSLDRWRIAGGLRLAHDEDLTVAALAATAPLGAAVAWAGERARPYLQSHGAGPEMVDRVLLRAAETTDPGFIRSSKRIGARLRVTLRDGRTLEAEREAAVGCCQESVEARVALAEDKLRGQLRRRDGEGARVSRYRRLPELSAAELQELVQTN